MIPTDSHPATPDPDGSPAGPGNTCPFCGRDMARKESRDLLGKDIGPVLACSGYDKGCRTYCKLHPRTGRPLGRPADPELRRLRSDLMSAIRPLWAHADRYHEIQEKGRWRKDVIRRLRDAALRRAHAHIAHEMGLPRLRILNLSKAECRAAIEIAKRNDYRSIEAAANDDSKGKPLRSGGRTP